MSEPSFDRIAKIYRWLEYATFGPLLQRCRTKFVSEFRCARALVLGDGDGRFIEHLLSHHPNIEIDSIDKSLSMLRLQIKRNPALNISFYHADALNFVPPRSYDLVATHFFFDCLRQEEVDAITDRLSPYLSPKCLWVVSEFSIPNGVMRPCAYLLVTFLYAAFRITTSLGTSRLPDHVTPLAKAGFTLVERRYALFRILVSELWRKEL
jgi:trans-aconitate methyltransferase